LNTEDYLMYTFDSEKYQMSPWEIIHFFSDCYK
jgi:hypothetical protein